jgi:hypothetical protein
MEKLHSVGNKYIRIDDSRYPEVFLLAQVGFFEVALVGLKSANRFAEAVKVDEISEITEEEFFEIAGGTPEEFEQIS